MEMGLKKTLELWKALFLLIEFWTGMHEWCKTNIPVTKNLDNGEKYELLFIALS